MRDELATPVVSVIIPQYNDPESLGRVVTAVRGQDYAGGIEIIVADDGSEVLPTVEPHPVVPARVVAQEDLGFRAAAARNLGAAHASGEVLAFLDGDTVPEPGYLTAVVPHVVADPRAVVIGTRLTGPQREEPGWLTQAWQHTDHLRDADDTSWRFIISAVLTCSKDFFDRIGGFDGSMVGYGGEDWEFGFRAWNAGATFVHEPAAIAVHPKDDFGGRHPEPDEEARVKNVESAALAHRITHPLARPQHVGFATADIGVHLRLPAGDDTPPGVAETVIASWLCADARVYVHGAPVPGLFSQEPRVRSDEPALAGDPQPEHISEIYPERIHVLLKKPWALTDPARFLGTVGAGAANGCVLDPGLVAFTRRHAALGLVGLADAGTSDEEVGVSLVDGPVRLERLFAGW